MENKMKTTIKKSILTILACGLTTAATAADYKQGMAVQLGYSWDPYYPMENKRAGGCFSHSSVGGEGVPTSVDQFQASLIMSESEFKSLTKIDAAGSASYSGAFDAGGTVSISRSRMRKDKARQIVWTISGFRKYNFEFSGDISMTDKGESILTQAESQNDPEMFYQRCGRTLVTSISKESRISVVYEFYASTAEKADQIRTAITANFDGYGVSADASYNLQKSIKSIDSEVQMNIFLVQVGVNQNSQALNNVITTEPGNLAQVRQKIKETLNGLNYDSSQVTEFEVTPVKRLFGVTTPDRLQIRKKLEKRLASYDDALNTLSRRVALLDLLLEKNQNGEIQLDETRLNEIDDEIVAIEDMEFSLYDQMAECQLASRLRQCPSAEVPNFDDITKWVKSEYVKAESWYATGAGGYDSHSEHMHLRAWYWPSISFKNLEFIDKIEIFQNGAKIQTLSYDEVLKLASANGILKTFINRHHDERPYCWRGDWSGCNRWGADKPRIVGGLKSREGGQVYKVIVTDIDGRTQEIDLGNATNRPLIIQ
jgi:hypothetical protein